MTADYLFIHAILITMRGNGVGILEDGAVAVTGNRISAVGATKEVLQDWSAHRVIDASGKVVMPGLIDAHIHTGDGLVRGVSQDLNNWMQHGLWPFEQELRKDVDAVCKGSLMNIVEALKAPICAARNCFWRYKRLHSGWIPVSTCMFLRGIERSTK